MALPKSNRVKEEKDINLLFRKGRAIKGRFLLIKFLETQKDRDRAVVIVSNKVQRKANIRNAIRRVLSDEVSKDLKRINNKDIAILVTVFPKETTWKKILREEACQLLKEIK